MELRLLPGVPEMLSGSPDYKKITEMSNYTVTKEATWEQNSHCKDYDFIKSQVEFLMVTCPRQSLKVGGTDLTLRLQVQGREARSSSKLRQVPFKEKVSIIDKKYHRFQTDLILRCILS